MNPLKAFTNFTESPNVVGAAHNGWTQQGGSVLITPEIEKDTVLPFKRFYGLFASDGTTRNWASWDKVPEHRDIDVIFHIPLALNTAQKIYFYVRSTFGEWYAVCLDLAANTIVFNAYTAAFYTPAGDFASAAFAYDTAAAYCLRITTQGDDPLVGSNGSLKAKLWLCTDEQPDDSSYQLSVTLAGGMVAKTGVLGVGPYSTVGGETAINCISAAHIPFNLIVDENDLSGAAWSAINAVPVTAFQIGPDGAPDNITYTTNPTANAVSFFDQVIAIPPSATEDHIFSIYTKFLSAANFDLECFFFDGVNIRADCIARFNFAGNTAFELGPRDSKVRFIDGFTNGWKRVFLQLPRDPDGSSGLMYMRIWGAGYFNAANVGSFVWGARIDRGTILSPNPSTAVWPVTPAALALSNLDYWAWQDAQPNLGVVAMLKYLAYNPDIASPYTEVATECISLGEYTSAEQDTPSSQRFTPCIKSVPRYQSQLGAGLVGKTSLSFGDLILFNEQKVRDRKVNMLKYSEDAYNAAWTKIAMTATANIAGAYDGKVRATRVMETAVNNLHEINQASTVATVIGTTYRYSVKLKGLGRDVILISLSSTTTWAGAYPQATVDLANKTISFYSAVGSMVQLENDWFLVTIDAVCIAVDPTPAVLVRAVAGGLYVYTGDVTLGFLVDQMHLRPITASDTPPKTTSLPFDQMFDPEMGHVRDDFMRRRFLKTPFTEILVGDPERPLHDWRTHMIASPSQPVSDGEDGLRFELKDVLGTLLDLPLMTLRYPSGSIKENSFLPALFGEVEAIELQEDIPADLQYRITHGPLHIDLTNNEFGPLIRENGLPFFTSGAGYTSDLALDEVIFPAPHGLALDSTIVFGNSGCPGGTTQLTFYHVKSIPGSARVTLCATPGGATIDLTTSVANTGQPWYGFNYYFPNSGLDGTIILTVSPQPNSRLIAGGTSSGAFGPGGVRAAITGYPGEPSPARVMNDILFTTNSVLTSNNKDPQAFAALDAYNTSMATALTSYHSGIWADSGAHSIKEIADEFARGAQIWWTASREGLIQVGQIKLPTNGDEIGTLTEDDILPDSMRIVSIIEAIDFQACETILAPWFLSGGAIQYPHVVPIGDQQRFVYTGYSSPIPIDSDPRLYSADKMAKFKLLFRSHLGGTILANHLVETFRRPLGVFECQARIKASRFPSGSVVLVEHRSGEWLRFSGLNPASPDDGGTTDCRLAIVGGSGPDITSPDAFNTQLTLIKPLPGYYPIQ